MSLAKHIARTIFNVVEVALNDRCCYMPKDSLALNSGHGSVCLLLMHKFGDLYGIRVKRIKGARGLCVCCGYVVMKRNPVQ